MKKKHSKMICIIAFAIVLSLSACTGNAPLNPTTTEQGGASSENAEGTPTGTDTHTAIAKELFERAATEIIKLATEEPATIVKTVLGDNVKIHNESKKIRGINYLKTSESYEKLKNYYSDIFIGDALDWILSTKFANVDGVLYCSAVGGATGWTITDTEVILLSQIDERYAYEATFKEVEFMKDPRDAITKQFIVEKIDNTYRIAEIDYVPDLLDNK